jgi:acyl-CoA dehydrogenase
VEKFVADEVVPLETFADSLPSDVLRKLREKAKREGLWAPHLPRELGGQGVELPDVCPAFEAAGRSLLGPLCLGCAAPDEGNAHLLHLAGSPAQKEKYLLPLAAGEIRSTFAMTEPAPGAGSDPSMMRTRALRDGDGWVIDGRKWFATGAAGAAFAIVAAVTEEDPSATARNKITLFLVDKDAPGYHVKREVPVMGIGTPGGHCEVELHACRVGSEQILGALNDGHALIQARLGPARLTHCMRWLGVAQRSLEIAARRAQERHAFGKPIAEHQAIQWMLADSAIEIHASRLMVHEAAWKLSKGNRARVETSACKVFVAETADRVIDRAIQVCGALGITDALLLARFYQEARTFRIYDGPSEVHRMVIARKVLKEAGGGGRWAVSGEGPRA